jgi:hypothetical protein
MAAIKMIALSMAMALLIGVAIPPMGYITQNDSNYLNTGGGINNYHPVDEKFEGGVKAYEIGLDDRVHDLSPDGSGGN